MTKAFRAPAERKRAGRRACRRNRHGSSDREIIEFARIEDRICITLDADFHAILALSGAAAPSVIRIRQEGLNGMATFRLVQAILSSVAEALKQGALIAATGRTLRIRRLPVENSGGRKP